MNVGERVRVVRALGDTFEKRKEGEQFLGEEFTIRHIIGDVPWPVQVEENHDLLFHPDELEVIE